MIGQIGSPPGEIAAVRFEPVEELVLQTQTQDWIAQHPAGRGRFQGVCCHRMISPVMVPERSDSQYMLHSRTYGNDFSMAMFFNAYERISRLLGNSLAWRRRWGRYPEGLFRSHIRKTGKDSIASPPHFVTLVCQHYKKIVSDVTLPASGSGHESSGYCPHHG